MATFNFFDVFATDAAAGTHASALNADTDTLKCYLTNATPDAAADSVKADLAEISGGNGYTAGGHDTTNAATTTSGVITVAGTDITITATGAVGPFRYVVLYNDTSASDSLIGWWDHGSTVTMAVDDTYTINFGSQIFTFGPA